MAGESDRVLRKPKDDALKEKVECHADVWRSWNNPSSHQTGPKSVRGVRLGGLVAPNAKVASKTSNDSASDISSRGMRECHPIVRDDKDGTLSMEFISKAARKARRKAAKLKS